MEIITLVDILFSNDIYILPSLSIFKKYMY